MRLTKGKWKASYKDTFSLDYTLAPIILAALQRFRDQSDKQMFGTPQSIFDEYELPDGAEEAHIIWEGVIDHMIYAFDSTNEPDINDYNFTYRYQGLIGCTNTEERDRYRADLMFHNKLKQAGYDLFAKYLTDLWW